MYSVTFSSVIYAYNLLFVITSQGNIYLPWAIAFQLKHIHCVVDSPAIVVKLNVACQALDANLNVQNDERTPMKRILCHKRFYISIKATPVSFCLFLRHHFS